MLPYLRSVQPPVLTFLVFPSCVIGMRTTSPRIVSGAHPIDFCAGQIEMQVHVVSLPDGIYFVPSSIVKRLGSGKYEIPSEGFSYVCYVANTPTSFRLGSYPLSLIQNFKESSHPRCLWVIGFRNIKTTTASEISLDISFLNKPDEQKQLEDMKATDVEGMRDFVVDHLVRKRARGVVKSKYSSAALPPSLVKKKDLLEKIRGALNDVTRFIAETVSVDTFIKEVVGVQWSGKGTDHMWSLFQRWLKSSKCPGTTYHLDLYILKSDC